MTLRSRFKLRAETDTGFLARNVLGFDFDKHTETGEVTRPGGIRPDGAHQEMVEFVDNPETRFKHLEAPRGSYKTTILQAYAIRRLLQNSNIRVLYGMETYTNALQTVGAIRQHFETNSKLREVWGDLRGKPWSREKIALSRTNDWQKEPSISAFGVDKVVVGGHYDVIIIDDLVSDQNVKTKDGLQKVRDCFQMLFPLLDPGGVLMAVGTRYHDDDLYGYIINNLAERFDMKIIDCGMQLEKSESGAVSLVGEARFEHLDEDFLMQQLQLMDDEAKFSSQYLNVCLSSASMVFFREQFTAMHFGNFMKDLSCYILTDTATSVREEGCYSTGILVGLDSQDNAYVLDAFVGHMSPDEFVSELLNMQERWESRVNVKKILMERICMNSVFHAMILASARDRKMRVNLVEVSRGVNDDSKKQRIQRLQGRFQRQAIFFVDTLPRVFHDLGQTRTLFDPEGYKCEDGSVLPDGELVLEFVRFPVYGKNDMADALADIDATDHKKQRICSPGNRRREMKRRQKRVRQGNVVPIEMVVNGRQQMVDVYRGRDHNPNGQSWITRYGQSP